MQRLRSTLFLTNVYRVFVGLCLAFLLIGCAGKNRPLQLISGAGPIYPEAAKSAGIEGRVVLQYDVTPVGKARNIVIVSSEPTGVFDEAAIVALRSWKFNAPVVDGVATEAIALRSTIEFQLDGADKYDQY